MAVTVTVTVAVVAESMFTSFPHTTTRMGISGGRRCFMFNTVNIL